MDFPQGPFHKHDEENHRSTEWNLRLGERRGDELDVTAARTLEARLADAPEVLAAVARLRRDRSSLRSVSTPAPPLDIVAELEPRIARAMLVEAAARLWQTKPLP